MEARMKDTNVTTSFTYCSVVNQHHDDHVGKWKKQRLHFLEEGSHEKASPSSAYVDFVFLDFACQWKSEDVS
jgi:hypothetical protein